MGLYYKGENIQGAVAEGGGSNVYSEDEIVVGEWIDGKPVYRKVVKLPNQTSNNQKITKDLSDLNIDSVLRCNGFAYYKTGGTEHNLMSFPYTEASNTFIGCGYLASEKNVVFVAYDFSFTFEDITVIIEYTKTTDAATK